MLAKWASGAIGRPQVMTMAKPASVAISPFLIPFVGTVIFFDPPPP